MIGHSHGSIHLVHMIPSSSLKSSLSIYDTQFLTKLQRVSFFILSQGSSHLQTQLRIRRFPFYFLFTLLFYFFKIFLKETIFLDSPYRNFHLYLRRLPCHFYLVAIEIEQHFSMQLQIVSSISEHNIIPIITS